MIRRVAKWAFEEAKEKLNVFATIREIRALGKKYGTRFLVFAVVWEIVEDVVFPILAWRAGVPELAPVFLILHFEPVVYPIAFWAFRTHDRLRGKAPWEPERSAMSSHWRSLAKITVYRIMAYVAFLGVFAGQVLSPWFVSIYMVLMTMFGFAHERIWHDSNYGITTDDKVETKRILAKAGTYRAVSSLVLGMGLYGVMKDSTPWVLLALYQFVMAIIHLGLGKFWASCKWGIRPVPAFSAGDVLQVHGADGVSQVEVTDFQPETLTVTVRRHDSDGPPV